VTKERVGEAPEQQTRSLQVFSANHEAAFLMALALRAGTIWIIPLLKVPPLNNRDNQET
jgi:hypothetical protein